MAKRLSRATTTNLSTEDGDCVIIRHVSKMNHEDVGEGSISATQRLLGGSQFPEGKQSLKPAKHVFYEMS